MRRLVWFAVLVLPVVLCTWLVWTQIACIPQPVNPGYIAIPQHEGKVDLSLVGGGAFALPEEAGFGAGALHVDVPARKWLSIPVGLSGGGGNAVGGIALRLGLRFRVPHFMSLGFGVAGGVFWCVDVIGANFLDLEAAIGGRWGIVGLSAAVRPTFEVAHGTFLLPVEVSVAFYVTERFGITVHALGSSWYQLEAGGDIGGWLGGGLGVVGHI